jgi:hypothetical protein
MLIYNVVRSDTDCNITTQQVFLHVAIFMADQSDMNSYERERRLSAVAVPCAVNNTATIMSFVAV